MGSSGQASTGGADTKPVERVKPRLFRKLQVHKSTPLGLLIPRNLQLDVRNVDNADQDLGPAFRTSSMNWMQLFVKFPPTFELYAATDDSVVDMHLEKVEPVAKVITSCGNGIMPTIANVEMLKGNEWIQYDHSLPSDIRRQWTVKREGWGRHYSVKNGEKQGLQGRNFTWKGSRQITDLLEDFNPHCHGNLKLLDSEGVLLAAWKQQRDSKVLGSIHIFEEARAVIPMEIIVVSCICIALVERINGVTFLGS